MRFTLQCGLFAVAVLTLARPSYRARRSVEVQTISGGVQWHTLEKGGAISSGSVDNGRYYLSRRAADPLPPSNKKVQATEAQKQEWTPLQDSLNTANDEVKTHHATAVEHEEEIQKLAGGIDALEISQDEKISFKSNLATMKGSERKRVRSAIAVAERERKAVVGQVRAFQASLLKGSDLHTQVGLAISQHPVPEKEMSKMGKEVIEALAKRVKG
jgi:hypothetical protein